MLYGFGDALEKHIARHCQDNVYIVGTSRQMMEAGLAWARRGAELQTATSIPYQNLRPVLCCHAATPPLAWPHQIQLRV